MRFVQSDYYPTETLAANKMATLWSIHWKGRHELKPDLRDEPLWPTIQDVLHRPGLVLEAGCGPGHWVQFFDSLGHRTVGLDFALSASPMDKYPSGDLRLLSGDLRALPFPNGTFDYIFSNGAVEHDISGPERAVREFHRVLKGSGRLMCSVPCLNIERTLALPWLIARDWLKHRTLLRRLAAKTEPFEFYQYVFSPGTYRSILAKCGFQVVALRPYGTMTGGLPRNLLARCLARFFRFYNPHMMMAICLKDIAV